MKERPNFYWEWQRLLDYFYDLCRDIEADKSIPAEEKLRRKVALEAQIIAGINATRANLTLAGKFEETEEAA